MRFLQLWIMPMHLCVYKYVGAYVLFEKFSTVL
jgi:hypothetical protein